MHWIGLDIGKRTIDIALPAKGNKYKYGRINNDERGFEVFVERRSCLLNVINEKILKKE